MKLGSYKVTKYQWYRAGGFKNTKCWRRQTKNGGWNYYIMIW